jgi:mannosyltransferase OCH1-like enzyme
MVHIPKTIHIIWVGTHPAPEACIRSWRAMNPSWNLRLWGNDDVANDSWQLKHLLTWAMSKRKYSAASDLMRYEILFNYGGFYADADSTALRPLDADLFKTGLVASWESEIYAPGDVNNAFLAAVPSHPVLKAMIEELDAIKKWPRQWQWRRFKFKTMSAGAVSGPALLTKHVRGARDVTILPSSMFSPEHFAGPSPQPDLLPYAIHHWGSMQRSRSLKNRRVLEAHSPAAVEALLDVTA